MTNEDLVYVGTISGYVAVLDSETVSLVTQYSWHEGKVRSLLLLPDTIRHSLCAEVPPTTDVTNNKPGLPKRQFGEVFSPMPPPDTHECYKQNLLVNKSLVASIGNGRKKQTVMEKDLKPPEGSLKQVINRDITLLMWHS